jgi:hypothetical protein
VVLTPDHHGDNLDSSGRPTIEITATSCRQGPPLSHPLAGREEIERESARAPADIRRRIRWLSVGAAVELAA